MTALRASASTTCYTLDRLLPPPPLPSPSAPFPFPVPPGAPPSAPTATPRQPPPSTLNPPSPVLPSYGILSGPCGMLSNAAVLSCPTIYQVGPPTRTVTKIRAPVLRCPRCPHPDRKSSGAPCFSRKVTSWQYPPSSEPPTLRCTASTEVGVTSIPNSGSSKNEALCGLGMLSTRVTMSSVAPPIHQREANPTDRPPRSQRST